jgi:proteasome lid subunit RPN8/RPN11
MAGFVTRVAASRQSAICSILMMKEEFVNLVETLSMIGLVCVVVASHPRCGCIPSKSDLKSYINI